jgi:hypothetical protein
MRVFSQTWTHSQQHTSAQLPHAAVACARQSFKVRTDFDCGCITRHSFSLFLLLLIFSLGEIAQNLQKMDAMVAEHRKSVREARRKAKQARVFGLYPLPPKRGM